MISKIGIALLFFLPVIESLHRETAFFMLLTGIFFVSLPLLKRPAIRLDWFDLTFLMLLIIMLATTITSSAFLPSFVEFTRYCAYFIFFLTMRTNIYTFDRKKRLFISMVAVNSLILTLFAIITQVLHVNIPGVTLMNLYTPIFGHNRLSELLVMGIPIVLYLFESPSKHKKLFSLFLSFGIVVFLISQGRAALVSLAISFSLVYFFFSRKLLQNHIQIKKMQFTILTLLVIAIVYLSYQFYYSNMQFSNDLTNQKVIGIYRPLILDQRINYLYQAFDQFIAHPWVGTGLDTFRYISRMHTSDPSTVSEYVHNHFIQMFVELGISGGLAFLLLIVLLTCNSLVRIEENLSDANIFFNLSLLVIVIASFLQSLLDFQWQFYSLFLLFWFALALLNPCMPTDMREKRSGRILIIVFALLIVSIVILKGSYYYYSIQLSQADSVGDNSKALLVLHKKLQLDSLDGATRNGLAYYSEKNGDFLQAHYWYKRAIESYPSQSLSVIKSDSSLYIKELESFLTTGDEKGAEETLGQFAFYYPFLEKPLHNELYNYPRKDMYLQSSAEYKQDLQEFIREMREYIYKQNISYTDVISVPAFLR